MDDFWGPVDSDPVLQPRVSASPMPWRSPSISDATPLQHNQALLGSASPSASPFALPSNPASAPRSQSSQAYPPPLDDDSLPPLGFLHPDEWDEHNCYREDEPTYIHYAIEWKIVVNNKAVARDTEQDVVLAPGAYWHMCLKDKVEKLASKKTGQSKERQSQTQVQVQCEETNITVSVTDRTKRDLVRRFDDMAVDWSVVQTQLDDWSELFRAGRKLRVALAFVYPQVPAALSTRGGKHGTGRRGTATQRHLDELDRQIEGEQACNDGRPPAWQTVYKLMQCAGGPCHNKNKWCWQDVKTERHYVLKHHHLKSLTAYVEDGGVLASHEDVPEEMQEQLLAEEEQRVTRQSKMVGSTPQAGSSSCQPINITNIMPSSDVDRSTDSSSNTAQMAVVANIPGPRDEAVRDYRDWHLSQVSDEAYKTGFKRACELALEDCMDLEQVHLDQDIDFFVKGGVKRGIACMFVREVPRWAKRLKEG